MVLVGLRIVMTLWFLLELFQTLQYYHPSAPGRDTYIRMAWVFTPWFLSFPIYVAIAAIIAAHSRDKVVISLIVLTDALALVVLAVWFKASWVADHFDSSGQIQGRYSVVPGPTGYLDEAELDGMMMDTD